MGEMPVLLGVAEIRQREEEVDVTSAQRVCCMRVLGRNLDFIFTYTVLQGYSTST